MFSSEKLEKDLNIIATYELIDRCDFKPLALHGVNHVKNVTKNVGTILTELNCGDETVECGKIAAYLHDLGMKEGKKGHAKRSYTEAKKYLRHKDLTFKQKHSILKAIKNHSNCNKKGDIIWAALVFADKLDMDNTRLGEDGYYVDGLKEIRFVTKVDFKINAEKLVVTFNVTPEFDRKSFENYYFCRKMFNAVKQFANQIKRDYVVMLNDQVWDY